MNPANLALELWDVLRDHVPGKKAEAARAFLQVFAENGVDRDEMIDVRDDDDLDGVFDDVFDSDDDPEWVEGDD